MMQLKAGFVFKDPKTDFTWKISHPWVNRWTKRQVGWLCKKVGPHLEQYPVSRWSEREIMNILEQVEPTETSPWGESRTQGYK